MASTDPAKKKHVWLVGTTFEPRGSSLYTLRLARLLPELGFEPTIVCESSLHIPTDVREKHQVLEVPQIRSRFLGPYFIKRLIDSHSERRPVLVHAQRREAEDTALMLADRFDCGYLLTVHGLLPDGQILRLLPDHVAAIIAVSPSVERDLVLGASVPSDMVHMIPSGVEVPDALMLPSNRDEGKVPIVGTASALEPVKGLTYFLMAVELLLSSGYDLECLIAGSGPDEEALRRAAQHLDIANRVTFAPHVERYTEVIAMYDVFVIPSLEQGLGTVMFEAMALSKPVVATRVGGIADFLVDGEHALLVPKANHVVLAERIKLLLDNPDRARRLAVNGHNLVREHFTVETMAERTARLYERILDQPNASAASAAENGSEASG